MFIVSPSKVTISGPKEARLYESIVVKCVSRPANPAANIAWLVENDVSRPSTMETESDQSNGWIVKSTLNFAITSNIPSVKTFTCKTEPFLDGESVESTHKVSIICEFELFFFDKIF